MITNIFAGVSHSGVQKKLNEHGGFCLAGAKNQLAGAYFYLAGARNQMAGAFYLLAGGRNCFSGEFI